MDLDGIDWSILKALEKNARKPLSSIAENLGVSNTMVHQRYHRLLESGVLKKTTIEIDEQSLGFEWSTFTGIILKEDSDSAAVVEALKKIEEVTECYYITGTYTLYLRIVAKSSRHMREILYEKIDLIPGILKTESLVNFGTAFKRNAPLSGS